MVLGSNQMEENEDKSSTLVSMVTLIMNPFIIAMGVIAMRQMRKMHESVLSCYMNLSLGLIMVTIVYASGSDLSVIKDFGKAEWTATILMSLAVVISQRFRFKAFQNCEPGKLQSYSFI